MIGHSRRWFCSWATFSKFPYSNCDTTRTTYLLNMLPQGFLRMYCIMKSAPVSSAECGDSISYINDLKMSLQRLCLTDRILEASEVLKDMKKKTLADNMDFELIVGGCLRRNDVPKALELFSEMKQLGLSHTAASYNQMVQCLLKSGDHDEASNFFTEMLDNNVDPEIATITALLHNRICQANIDEAWIFFEKIKDVRPVKLAKEVYSFFITKLCQSSRPEEAFKLLIEMSKLKIYVSNKIIHLFTSCLVQKLNIVVQRKFDQVDKLDKADIPVDGQRNPEGSSLVMPNQCNQLDCSFILQEISSTRVQTECSREDLNEVCKILHSSKEWNLIVEDLENRTISFTPELVSEILNHCQKQGHTALHFFSWLKNIEGYVHTTKTYNMAIKISGGAKDFKHMRNLFFDMRRERCPITPDTWTIMISQYGQAGLTEMALNKFKEMKVEGHPPNASTFKFLIIFLCGKKGRKTDDAVNVFQEMIQSGYLPDKEMVEIYLSCLCEMNKISQARKSVKLLCKSGFPVQVSKSILVRSLCRAGKLSVALKLIDQMERLGYPMTKYIYGSLVHGLLREGNLDEAMVKVKAMEKSGIALTVHIRTSFMVHYLERKQIDKANDIFKKMGDDGCLPTVVTCSAFIRGLVSTGMISDAWDVFNRMKIEGPLPDFKTYSMFIASLCKAGRSEQGLVLLHEMVRKEIYPSAVNFKTVIYGLNREGKRDLACSVLHMKWGLSRKRKFLT